jgi:hypothetical protein
MHFKSTILTVPGLGGSGPEHWQSIWEKNLHFSRIEQADWDTPDCREWIENINNEVIKHDRETVVLVGHSLGCAAIAFWAKKYPIKIRGH